ncbi:MAG TPA: response regulator [Gemmatimonadaceae bacterium]|nr:response regulator [Gemmatimonadaceae bacterium]
MKRRRTDTAAGAKAATALATVWEQFREVTFQRVDVIEDAAVALLEGRLSPEQRREAEREAGKLAGSAGTFGFPRSSQIANQIALRLATESPAQLDAVFISEQLLALRTDLEGRPQPVSGEMDVFELGDTPLLLLVGVDGALTERIVTDGEARGLRVISAPTTEVARSLLATEHVAAAVLSLDSGKGDEMLEFITELGSRVPPIATLVITERDTFADRLDVARRGARKFLEQATPARAVVDAAMIALRQTRGASATILIVDDDKQILELLQKLLTRRGMKAITLDDSRRFWDVLEEESPDLILLDLGMPHYSGLDLCRVMRNDRHWSKLPVIFLTGQSDPASFQEVFAAGGDDIVLKPFAGFELVTRVENRLQRARVDQEIAETDELTGLANQKRATELMARFLRLAKRKADTYSVVVVEVDLFSRLSEKYGAAAADTVVISVAQLLTKSFRAEDVIGRWSGGEFTIGMYGSDKEHAAIKLSNLFALHQRQRFAGDGGGTFHATLSAGVSQFLIDGVAIEEVRGAALEALAHAKAAGMNQVVQAGAPVPQSATLQIDVALVDDDEAIVGLLLHTMQSRGLKVVVFPDGEAAVAGLTGNVPEVQARVILLDVDVPALNGLEVLRRLNSSGITEKSSVVMLTARTGESDILATLDLGAADHIAKPFSVPVLMHKVRSVLRQSRG